MITVNLWRLDLDDAEAPADRRLLSRAECDRADRFVRPGVAARFVAVRAELRRRLGEATGTAPADLDLVAGQHGKPMLREGGVFFNVSHSHDAALIALCGDADVGVDIERVQPIEASVVDTFLADSERRALERLPEEERLRAVYRVWCRKEALLKGLGVGLTAPLDGLAVSLGPQASVVWSRESGVAAWRLHDVATGRDYEAALAVRSNGRPVRVIAVPGPSAPCQA